MCWAIRRIIPIRQEAREAVRAPARRRRSDGFFFQPCFSPVWDTAIAAYALGEVRAWRRHPRWSRAADWLLTKEVRRKGDWSVKRPNVEPSGWYFEFANEFYPDIDDTAHGAAGAVACAGLQSGRTSGCRASRAWTGCSPCSRATAAGRRSTSTTTGSS